MTQDSGIDRRAFMARAAALMPVASLAKLSGCGFQTLEESWVGHARSELPATRESAYFQTGGIAPSPRSVIAEVAERLEFQNRGPADPRFSSPMAEIEPQLRAHLSGTFGVAPNGVALTHSTSEGISIAAWSRDWEPGDEVILSNQEHPANVVPWYILRDRFGVVIREIDLRAGSDLVDEIRAALSASTRMVSISHVSRNNGRRVRTDQSADLARLLRPRGIIYHLDGAQGPGCVPVDFEALGCDCYSTCGHKWLLGPKGTGAFFVREDQLDRIKLSWAGSHSHSRMDYEGTYELLPSAARYEFGTRALADFAGFDRALSWMEEFGLGRIHARIQSLVGHAIERTQSINGVGISSPEAEADRSGVFVVRLPPGCNATTVYQRLSSEEGILTSPVRDERDLRIAIHFFNTESEIDAALEAVESVC